MPPHALFPGPLRQLRRAPPAQVRAPHHVCSLQVPKRKRQHRRQARLAGGGADDAVVPTFCYKIEAVLRMRLCDPDQLIGKKRRNKLTAADTLFATSRAVSLERMNTTLGFHRHTLGGWSSKSCTRTAEVKTEQRSQEAPEDRAGGCG